MIKLVRLLLDLAGELTLEARCWLARWLCPDLRRDAEGYRRIMGNLDQARWWLGKKHPIAGSLAQHILDCERHYTGVDTRDPRLTWQPPEWAYYISNYRDWLDSRPFGDPATELEGYRWGAEAIEADLKRQIGIMQSDLEQVREALADSEAMRDILTRANKELGGEMWDHVEQEEAKLEIARLRARLEVVTATTGSGKTIPFQPGWPDGISARDETIRNLDAKVDRIVTQRDTLQARVHELTAECADLRDKLHSYEGPRLS